MKIKYLLISISLIFTIFLMSNVNAMTIGKVNNLSGINLRIGPGTNYKMDGKAGYNEALTILNTKTFKGNGCNSGWYKVNSNNSIRYVCSSELALNSTIVKAKSKVQIRNGASTSSKIFKTISKNTIVNLNGKTKYKGSGCSKGWYKIYLNNSSAKYICSNYTKSYNEQNIITITKGSGSYLRTKTSKNGKNSYRLTYGTPITLKNTKKYSGYNCKSKYYKVTYKGKKYYVCSGETIRTNLNEFVTADGYLTVRSSASTSGKKIAIINYGNKVALASTTKYKGSGCSAGWYKIHINGQNGYVCSSYVSTSNIIASAISNVNIKSSNNNSSSNYGTLYKNQNIALLADTKYSGNGCSKGFYKVSYNGSTGYVCSNNLDYLSSSNPVNTSSASVSTATVGNEKITSRGNYNTINKWDYRVNEDYAYVRTSTTGSIKDTVYLGTELEVLSSSKATSNCSAGWYKVKYFTNKTGYICKTYVDKYNSITKTNNSYCTTLKNKGFPASYCPYLSYLHAKYPNWVFKPEKTGVTFDKAVKGEANKNYTQMTKSPYIASSSIAEAGGWRVASTKYVGFMIDPRNYLNEKNIFAFENLGYDKTTQTKALVQAVFNNTWLNTNTYSGYFVTAGANNKVSPIHLAARVKQEGGTNKSYAGVSGTVSTTWNVANKVYICASEVNANTSKKTISVKSGTVNIRKGAGTNYATLKYPNGKAITVTTQDKLTFVNTTNYKTSKGCSAGWYKINVNKSLKGVYNFYNIGAYGSNPVVRGLATAAGYVDDEDGTPWNTYQKAINYGAKFIASGYITKGQDTLFYQKFNVGPNNYFNKYTHQYMTNILAPASEGLSSYRSYNNMKILNKAYTFKIPVYNSMPAEITSHPVVK